MLVVVASKESDPASQLFLVLLGVLLNPEDLIKLHLQLDFTQRLLLRLRLGLLVSLKKCEQSVFTLTRLSSGRSAQ